MPTTEPARASGAGRRPLAPLHRYLVAVIVLATLPLAALVGWQIVSTVRGERLELESNLARSAAALSQALDGELIASLDALNVLAHAGGLQRGRPEAFRRWMQEAPRPRRDWDGIFLLDQAGARLFDTDPGAPAPPPALAQDAVRRAQPVISGPGEGTGPAAGGILLAVPVQAAGGAVYVLGARVGPGAWQRLARTASRSEEGYALLHDAEHRLIAWTLAPDLPSGLRLPADAVAGMRGRPFGLQRAGGIDGRTVYAAWHQVPLAGWGVQVGVPADAIDAGHRHAVAMASGLVIVSLLLGALLATVAARRIARPLQRMARGGPLALEGPIAVREIAVLRDALQQAARTDEQARRDLEADIAQRRQVESDLLAAHEQLQGNQALMELAQEAGHVGFFHYRFQEDQLVWTPGQCKLFGLEASDGSPLATWFDRIAEEDRTRVEREFWTACALRRDTATLEYGTLRPDGRRRWLSSRLLLRYGEDGVPRQMTGVTVDMSDQREAELQRAQLTERALAARQEAEAASRAKDEFLSMLGHELRNPLGAIAAAVDVLDAAVPGSPSAAEARAIIARQTRNLAHMMNDLLDVGRVMAGRIVLARQPVDLAAVFDRLRRTLELTGEWSAHAWTVRASGAWVEGDAVRLEQVMGNLLANAIKYTPPGGAIEVAIGCRGGHALFEVRDGGPGIAPALLPHIFDLFVQGERPLDRGAGGLGLGLTLVRRLVELHGGRAGVESSESGSRFTVELPAIDAPEQPAGDALPPSRRRRVLVVDDNADVLSALRSKLEYDGHTVSTAADGIDGLSRLLHQQPEVSIVDIGLPGITGYELARHARAAGYAGRLIALSGYGQERDRRDALVAGFDAYLVKPVDRTQLRASLAAD
jgi:signal transduction histidine kinase